METKRNVIRFFFLIIFFFIFVNIVSAYDISINVPSTLTVGEPLTITGNTSYPVNDLIATFYSMVYTPPSIVKSQPVTLQNEPPLVSFSSTFFTKDLPSGPYKIEVVSVKDKKVIQLTMESINEKPVFLYPSPYTQTPTPTIATTPQVTTTMTSIPTPVSTTLPPTSISTTLPPITQAATPTPTPLGHIIVPPLIVNNGTAAIVSFIISLTLFGFIEYSGVYWQNKKRK